MSYTVSKCYHMLPTGQTRLPASFLKDLWSEGAGASRLLSYPNATTDLRDQQHAAHHTPTGACQHSHDSYEHLPQKLQKGVSSSELQRERSASLSHKHIRLQTCNSSMLPQVSQYTSVPVYHHLHGATSAVNPPAVTFPGHSQRQAATWICAEFTQQQRTMGSHPPSSDRSITLPFSPLPADTTNTFLG